MRGGRKKRTGEEDEDEEEEERLDNELEYDDLLRVYREVEQGSGRLVDL